MLRMIILRRAPRWGPPGRPGGTSGRPPASLTSWMLKTVRFPLFERLAGQSSSEDLSQAPQTGMILAPVGMISGPEDRPGHSRGPPDASRTLHVPKTLKFLRFLQSEELLSTLSEISHRLPRDGQNVCIFSRK